MLWIKIIAQQNGSNNKELSLGKACREPMKSVDQKQEIAIQRKNTIGKSISIVKTNFTLLICKIV